MILLPLPPDSWYYRYVPIHPASFFSELICMLVLVHLSFNLVYSEHHLCSSLIINSHLLQDPTLKYLVFSSRCQIPFAGKVRRGSHEMPFIPAGLQTWVTQDSPPLLGWGELDQGLASPQVT